MKEPRNLVHGTGLLLGTETKSKPKAATAKTQKPKPRGHKLSEASERFFSWDLEFRLRGLGCVEFRVVCWGVEVFQSWDFRGEL